MKKRNKAYKPRLVTVPMMFITQTVQDRFPHLAIGLYGQIIAFCEQPNFETSNNLSRQICIIAGGMSHMRNGVALKALKDPASVAICSAVYCMEGIGKRYDETGVISVKELEKQTLKAAAGRLDEVLQIMPLACYIKAEQESDMWLKEAREPQREAA